MATNPVSFLSAAGAGMALMYLLDPERGNRRRKLITDQLQHARRVTTGALGTSARDLRNRTQGVVASTRARFAHKGTDDAILDGRIRAQLGRLVSHPGAVSINVDDGHVTLSGAVLADEADELISGVRAIRGVQKVEDRMSIYQNAENVMQLQGGRRKVGQRNWTPTTRILSGAMGTALAIYGMRRRGPLGALLGTMGAAMAARGITNMPTKRLTGVAAGRNAVEVQKTITINAPIERVFPYFMEWENWPNWMSHVQEVQSTGAVEDRAQTHWVVDGPAGTTVEWDAIVTKLIPEQEIAWKSMEGAAVEHAGSLRFTPTVDGATTVEVKMSYNPPAGAMGHAVATLFGRDPKHQLDDDLARLKTTIETGTPPRDAARAEHKRGGQKKRSSAKASSSEENTSSSEIAG